MDKTIFQKDRFLIMDGAVGTMLQQAGLPAGQPTEQALYSMPEQVVALHRAYAEAGAGIICAVTFGANRKKLAGTGLAVEDVVRRGVELARQGCEGTDALVALDIGPLGEMLEPAGTLHFEEAYDIYAEVMRAGAAAGADLVVLATMTDLYEVKAALLAARENTVLPVICSMSFEEGGRTFSGMPVEAMAALLPGLGACAIGINCSMGPEALMPVAERLVAASPVPVFLKPNAGLPDPSTGGYTMGAREFLRQMQPCLQNGIAGVGGCCGTTPEFITLLAGSFGGKAPAPTEYKPRSVLSSGTRVAVIDRVSPIGERINPTGKKRLREALAAGDLGYVQTLAAEQQRAGAALLDVNVGAPGVDEVQLLPLAVKAVQAVSDLPLVLDSANIGALEAALRVCNGKPLVNSTSAEAEKLAAILPLCRRYGAAVVGLTLDEDGIPTGASARFALAAKILNAALAAGLAKEDVYIDCLTLAASADESAPLQTLKALEHVKKELGLKTLLGVSNISFGLPRRPLVNEEFLSLALQRGLDLPILNPTEEGMMGTIAAFELLSGKDPGARRYIARFGEGDAPKAVPAAKEEMTLGGAIEAGLKAEAAAAAAALLAAGSEGLAVVNDHLIPALDRVGAGFETGEVFLPQLLAAATAAQAAFDEIRRVYGPGDTEGEPVVVATVRGDVHDIGKNIAKVLLENYGFQVIDLGRDVPPERVVEAAKTSGARLVGLSALMTTTLPAMAQTIEALRAGGLDCKVMVGGAVLTPEYAASIGADYYVKDARRSVEAAQEVYPKS